MKSSGYVQAWKQTRPSSIVFIGLQRRARTADGGLDASSSYKADVYVFAWHTEGEPDRYDALDVDRWAFHVVSRDDLLALGVGSIGLARLSSLSPEISYPDLAAEIARVSAR